MKYFLISFHFGIPSANLDRRLLPACSLVSSVGPLTNARFNDFECPPRVMDFVVAVIEKLACINTRQPKHHSASLAKPQVQIQVYSSVAMRPKYRQAPRRDHVGSSRLLFVLILARPCLAPPAYKAAVSRGSFLAPLRKIHGFRVGQHTEGYITYVVLMLVLAVMGTTIALADRTSSGLAGQMRQSVLRDAELATENGLTRTITDFNSPGNRYVWGVNTENWTDSNTIKTGLYPTVCNGKTYFPNNADLFELTGQTEAFKRIKERRSTLSKFTEEWLRGFIFQVIGITIKDENHKPIEDITAKENGVVKYPKGPSFVEFRVRGIHNSIVQYDTNWDNTNATVRNSMVVGWRDDKWTTEQKQHDVSFEITREYKLMPFCCSTGFIDKKVASDVRSMGSVSPSCDTTYNPDDYNLTNTKDGNSSFKGNSNKEKMGWTIVGPSSTGIFRSSL